MMRVFTTLILSFCLFATTIQATSLPENNIAPEVATAIQAFAGQIDAGNLESAFYSGSLRLQESFNQDLWIDQTRRTFNSLGNIINRKLVKSRTLTAFPMLPDDSYLIVYHELKMDLKAKALEIALLRNEDGQWKICAYSVR